MLNFFFFFLLFCRKTLACKQLLLLLLLLFLSSCKRRNKKKCIHYIEQLRRAVSYCRRELRRGYVIIILEDLRKKKLFFWTISFACVFNFFIMYYYIWEKRNSQCQSIPNLRRIFIFFSLKKRAEKHKKQNLSTWHSALFFLPFAHEFLLIINLYCVNNLFFFLRISIDISSERVEKMTVGCSTKTQNTIFNNNNNKKTRFLSEQVSEKDNKN